MDGWLLRLSLQRNRFLRIWLLHLCFSSSLLRDELQRRLHLWLLLVRSFSSSLLRDELLWRLRRRFLLVRSCSSSLLRDEPVAQVAPGI